MCLFASRQAILFETKTGHKRRHLTRIPSPKSYAVYSVVKTASANPAGCYCLATEWGMEFKEPRAERAWRHEQCLLRRRHDCTTAAVTGLLTAAWLAKPVLPRPQQASHLVAVLVYVAVQISLTAFGTYSAWRQTLFWQKSRPEIVVFLQCLPQITFYVTLVRSGAFELLLKLPKHGEVDVWCLFIGCIMMARTAFRYSAPVNHVRVILWMTFGVSAILAAANRCRNAARPDPSTNSYDALVSYLVDNVSKLLPITCARTSMPVVANLTETGACVAIHTLCYGIFGVLFPITVIYAEEEVSRGRFEADNGLGCGFRHGHTMSAILHLCLLPFQAFVMLHAVLFAVQLPVFSRLVALA